MRTVCFPVRGADRAAATGQGFCLVITACVVVVLRLVYSRSGEVLARRGLCGLTGRGADTALTAEMATFS
jgi:hypothetical protein